jgi:GNAT superfamily N-acetyltransferase
MTMKIDFPTLSDTPALRQLWQRTFGDNNTYLDTFFSLAFSPQRCMCLKADSQIHAAAYWLDCQIGQHKAAYLYAVATDEDSRGKGYCRALINAIHGHLTEKGYCGSILVPGGDGLREMYRRMGYENFGGIREFTCAAAENEAALVRIHKAEFALLRRQYLANDAVIQEGESLALLDALAKFYRGTDFLLAFSDGCILELLGNAEKAPAIVKALGRSEAVIRTPGKEPFAMYHSLSATSMPKYFAFAFD